MRNNRRIPLLIIDRLTRQRNRNDHSWSSATDQQGRQTEENAKFHISEGLRLADFTADTLGLKIRFGLSSKKSAGSRAALALYFGGKRKAFQAGSLRINQT